MKVEIGQIITQIISFLIMLWVLKRFAWKPLLNLLEERKNMIKSEFVSIEDQKNELAQLMKEYHQKHKELDVEAVERIQIAIEKGTQAAEEIQKQAHHQARHIVSQAQEDLQREILKAKMQLKNELIHLTLATTEKVLQENLDPVHQKKLITDFVEKTGLH